MKIVQSYRKLINHVYRMQTISNKSAIPDTNFATDTQYYANTIGKKGFMSTQTFTDTVVCAEKIIPPRDKLDTIKNVWLHYATLRSNTRSGRGRAARADEKCRTKSASASARKALQALAGAAAAALGDGGGR